MGIGGGGVGGALGSIGGTASETLKKNVSEPLCQATAGVKKAAGQATAIVTNTAGQATTTVKQTAGQTIDGVKQTAGQAAAEISHSAGQATATVKQTASQVVAGIRNSAGQAADTVSQRANQAVASVKHTVSQTTNTIKRTGGEISDWSKEHVNKPIGQAAEQVRAQGGKVTDWTHEHINRPVGQPWNRAVRDPWERYLNRIVSTGEDRRNKAADRFQTGVVDGTNRVPQENAGKEFNYQNVPNGQVTKSQEGSDIIAVNAPNGGTVGFDVSPGFEGREVTMTMVVLTEPGKDQARIALGQDDGQVIETSNQASKIVGYWPTKDGKLLEIRELTMTTQIPSDQKDYGRTDSAHDYRALLQLDQGASVQVVLGGVQLAKN
jgi:hypothetical protein